MSRTKYALRLEVHREAQRCVKLGGWYMKGGGIHC